MLEIEKRVFGKLNARIRITIRRKKMRLMNCAVISKISINLYMKENSAKIPISGDFLNTILSHPATPIKVNPWHRSTINFLNTSHIVVNTKKNEPCGSCTLILSSTAYHPDACHSSYILIYYTMLRYTHGVYAMCVRYIINIIILINHHQRV